MMMNNLWTRLEFVLSISAIAAAGLFAILCIIFIVIVIVKLKGTLPYTHTHTFNGPLSGTTRVSRYQKGKNQSGFYWSKRQ